MPRNPSARSSLLSTHVCKVSDTLHIYLIDQSQHCLFSAIKRMFDVFHFRHQIGQLDQSFFRRVSTGFK